MVTDIYDVYHAGRDRSINACCEPFYLRVGVTCTRRVSRAVFHLSPIQKLNWNAALNSAPASGDATGLLQCRRDRSLCFVPSCRNAAMAVCLRYTQDLLRISLVHSHFDTRFHRGNLISEIMPLSELELELDRVHKKEIYLPFDVFLNFIRQVYIQIVQLKI